MGTYSRGTYPTYGDMPADDTDLTTTMSAGEISDLATINNVFVGQNLSAQIAAQQYKNTCSASLANLVWVGQSDLAPSVSPVILQAYNYSTAAWINKVTNSTAATNATCTLAASVGATQYLSPGGYTTSRVYQSTITGVQLGVNLLTDGDMEDTDDADPVYWIAYGTPTTREKNTTTPIDGARDLHLVMDAVNEGAEETIVPCTAGQWYRCTVTVKVVSGYAKSVVYDSLVAIGTLTDNSLSSGTNTAKCSGIAYNTSSVGMFRLLNGTFAANAEMYYDDAAFQQITKSSLFTQQSDTGSSDVTVGIAVTCPSLYAAPAGVAICMDANDPTKYILGVVNRNSGYVDAVQIYKVDGTSVTKVSDVTIGNGKTYGATKVVQLVKSGDTVTINYDGAQQDQQTISGYAGTIHAAFNTDDDNDIGTLTFG